MAEIILVTGGCRSGKSNYAEKRVCEIGGDKLYIATAPVLDSEMADRVAKHQQNRKHAGWITIEEELDLNSVFQNNPNFDSFLVDCLTLWINNLMFDCEKSQQQINEEFISKKTHEMLQILADISARVVLVINEVGMGVVPENHLARLFRDLSGRCAQIIAQNANEVILMSCGLPLKLK